VNETTTLGRDRAQLLDAADGVDRLLDLVRQLGLDLLGRSPGQRGDHHDDRQIDVGETIQAEFLVADDADDQDDQDHHRREDGASDAYASEPLHGGLT
jgi:hypothetical protein